MKLFYVLTKPFPCLAIGFVLGIIFSWGLFPSQQTETTAPFIATTTVYSSVSETIKPKIYPTTNFTINYENILQFYEEYYRYYEQNKEWLKKSYLGIHFLQNPNDAITIAEILYEQDVDLVIETGSYRGASALFFASVMYQYRYNASLKTIRPFKVITMDITSEAKTYIDRYPLLANSITFIPHSSISQMSKSIVNQTFAEMKAKNVFISLDGDHFAQAVYEELVYYQNYSINIGNYILVQDTRLSSKWHTMYCVEPKFDGPCNGPQEGVNWYLKNEGQKRFVIDPTKEYLFSTHHQGWLKRIAH